MIPFNIAYAREDGEIYVRWAYHFTESYLIWFLRAILEHSHYHHEIKILCLEGQRCANLEDLAWRIGKDALVFDATTLSWWMIKGDPLGHGSYIENARNITEVTPEIILRLMNDHPGSQDD